MRIAGLVMDAQDKTRFEIQGKSSIKYHLKANHTVEAKRWFWALNNAIQWAKDEAKDSEQRKNRDQDSNLQSRSGHVGMEQPGSLGEEGRSVEHDKPKLEGKGLTAATAIGLNQKNQSRVSLQDPGTGTGSSTGDNREPGYVFYDPSVANDDVARIVSATYTGALAGDLDEDEEYGDDASSHEIKPAPKDALNITANSVRIQLDLLAQVSTALQSEITTKPATTISDPAISQAISTYDSAVRSVQSMVSDLLKIARDRDAYWQYKLDREADMRRLWEASMAQVAKEQEVLEGRIGESEMKRKRTKRALREALDGSPATQSRSGSQILPGEDSKLLEAMDGVRLASGVDAPSRRKSLGARDVPRRKSTIPTLNELSDSESEVDEEFFDAVDAGEIEILDATPSSASAILAASQALQPSTRHEGISKYVDISSAFTGYEEPVRKRLKMDADDRPKISLWVRPSSKVYAGLLMDNRVF